VTGLRIELHRRARGRTTQSRSWGELRSGPQARSGVRIGRQRRRARRRHGRLGGGGELGSDGAGELGRAARAARASSGLAAQAWSAGQRGPARVRRRRRARAGELGSGCACELGRAGGPSISETILNMFKCAISVFFLQQLEGKLVVFLKFF
jgi:hypothetical protein